MQRKITLVDLQHSNHPIPSSACESGPLSSNLTPRQWEIANMLATTGFSYKEVALQLDISEGTMRKHAEHVYRRLGVHSRAELTVAIMQEAANIDKPDNASVSSAA